jgi:putative phage-type endonuclease
LKFLNLKQNTPEWLEFRKKCIGASDAPIIMGNSPYKTPLKLWREKVGLDLPQEENFRMRRGKELEPIALAKYCQIKGKKYAPEVGQSTFHPWKIASFDGVFDMEVTEVSEFWISSFSIEGAVEIKCPGKVDHETAKQGQVPEHYKDQLTHQMMVGEINNIDYFSFDGTDGVIVKYEYDALRGTALHDAEMKFIECIRNLEPPPATGRDEVKSFEDMEHNSEWDFLISNYLQARRDSKLFKEKEELLKEAILELAAGKDSKGKGVVLSRQLVKGNIDYKLIPELQYVDLEQYRSSPYSKWVIKEI